MRVKRLTATNVHGYLPLNANFDPTLTFLIGLNGCGKTTALRLLMGLLTPSLDELAKIEFEDAEVEIELDSGSVVIHATRLEGRLSLSVTDVDGELRLEAPALEFLIEPRRREESRAFPLMRLLQESPVFEKIRSLPTPMFLGLDRQLYQDERLSDPNEVARRRQLLHRRVFIDEGDYVGVVGVGLLEVVSLVRDTMSEIRARQEKLDSDLRESILLSALRFTPASINQHSSPTDAVIGRYREKRKDLQRAAEILGLPVGDVQQPLDDYFAEMAKLSTALISEPSRSPKRTKKPNTADDQLATANSLLSWLLNKSQVDRILENLDLFERYARDRDVLHEPINRLLGLLNKFLVQSRKRIEITNADRLSVLLPDGRSRTVTALSSGERQLCVMLGHLVLNPQLAGSGVFIVDEPELSLHLAWQEIFVDSVQMANPNVQMIFATHSPAIIMDKEAHCRSLDGGGNEGP